MKQQNDYCIALALLVSLSLVQQSFGCLSILDFSEKEPFAVRVALPIASPGATGRLGEAKPPQCVTQASPDSEACNKNLTDSVDVSCHI